MGYNLIGFEWGQKINHPMGACLSVLPFNSKAQLVTSSIGIREPANKAHSARAPLGLGDKPVVKVTQAYEVWQQIPMRAK